LVPLDLRQFDQLDAMAASLYQRFGRIDIFVSCAAALGHLAPTGHFEPALVQEVIDVNFTANWRLIRALDPLLRASPAGRAIFATCIAARETEPYWAPYAASKAALEALVKSYAEEVAQSTLRVNLVDPGPMRTALRFAAFPFEERDKIKPPEDATEPFVTLAEESCTENGALLAL
jgi:NAD(P)-dependent dehydrogenase (short-subunit alcohol dehydrogenase family)